MQQQQEDIKFHTHFILSGRRDAISGITQRPGYAIASMPMMMGLRCVLQIVGRDAAERPPEEGLSPWVGRPRHDLVLLSAL